MEKTVFVNGQTVITAEFLNYLQDIIEILENSISGGESGSGSVISVNGKSGIVTLTASNVGALPLTGGTVTGDTEFSGELKSTGTFKIQGSATSYVTIQNGQPGELTLANLEGTHVPVDNVATPETDYQAANKSYVDSAISAAVGAADTLLGTGEVTA